jgi:hypothetical protein
MAVASIIQGGLNVRLSSLPPGISGIEGSLILFFFHGVRIAAPSSAASFAQSCPERPDGQAKVRVQPWRSSANDWTVMSPSDANSSPRSFAVPGVGSQASNSASMTEP